MIERPTKEWAEKSSQIFSRGIPDEIRVRGDGLRSHFHQSELLLAQIYFKTIEYFKTKPDWSYYKREEILADQERALYLLCNDFQLAYESVFIGHRRTYDFVVRPSKSGGTYELALSNKLMLANDHDVFQILEFQYINLVELERFNEVEFLQRLNNYVCFYLEHTYPIALIEKVGILKQWVQERVSRLSQSDKVLFYWYVEEYADTKGKYKTEQLMLEKQRLGRRNRFNEDEIGSKRVNDFPDLDNKPRIPFSCNLKDVSHYFQILCDNCPGTKEPFVLREDIDHLIDYYFSHVPVTTVRPRLKTVLSKQDLMVFIYNFSHHVSILTPFDKRTPIKHLIKLLSEVFPETVPASSMNSCYRNMRKTYESYKSEYREFIDIELSENRWTHR